MTECEFSVICKMRGFERLAPRFYARCIGDGIYQTIFTGHKKFIDTDSLNYSAQKSYYISLGLRSVYSRYPESIFIPGKDSGGYRPADLRDRRKYSGPFGGIEEEYNIMIDVGFDVLDSIHTQEALLVWWDLVQTTDTGNRIQDFCLVAPFLLCGNYREAENEICVSFMHNMTAYMSYCDRCEQGYFQRDPGYEQRIWMGAKEEMQLWRWCIGRKDTELSQYISQNYTQNMEWIHKYGIPTSCHTKERILHSGDYFK